MNEIAEVRANIGPTGQIPITERLKNRRDHLRQQLEDVENALAAMESSPEAAHVVDAISKLGHI